MNVLELDSIGVSYGRRRVLTAASLRAQSGRVTALIGRNGVGKTSLLRAGFGLQPLEHGTVRFMGKLHRTPSLPALARAGLFYLPARNILDPTIPLDRQVAAIARHFRGPAVAELVPLFGLEAVAGQRPASLSGGELRRAELALAAAKQPACLVADEPFRGLDPRDIDVIVGALRAMAERGMAIIVTGHEIATIRGLSDGVVWCVAGTTREFPDAAMAWNDAQLRQEFLGSSLMHAG